MCFDFDHGLSAEQRAQAWAIERMLEDHLYFAIVNERWMDDENFAKGPAHFFDGLPTEVRDAGARAACAQTCMAMGLAAIASKRSRRLAANRSRPYPLLLGDRTYLFGDTPCGADATAFAFAAAALTPFFTGGLRRKAESHENLMDYVDRMMGTYYPDVAFGSEAAA